MTKATTAPPSDLVTQRKHVAALESEFAALAGHLRQASADGDAATVMRLATRREMVPVLIADGRAALVPLELAGVEEQLAALADEEAGARAAVADADRQRELAALAVREAERRYLSALAGFQPLDNRRDALLRQRHALTTVSTTVAVN